MSIKRSNKAKKGKVNSTLTAEHIDKHNHKPTVNHDPYEAGEQSGKHAKPDAHLATTNAQAYTAKERTVHKAEPPPTQPLLTQVPSPHPLPTQPSFTSLSLSMLPPHVPSFSPSYTYTMGQKTVPMFDGFEKNDLKQIK